MAQLVFMLLLICCFWFPGRASSFVKSDVPASFLRIGYYDTRNLDRSCQRLDAKNANPNGTYSHVNWAYAKIDTSNWTIRIPDHMDQWSDFKALSNTKRMVSLGGWSDGGAAFKDLGDGIFSHTDTFVSNIVKFVEDEGIDGIEIDWEFPGVPRSGAYDTDFFTKTAGSYKSFLSLLKGRLAGSNRTLSLAIPAHPTFLDNFPLSPVVDSVDFIVFMTYNLHGQWDHNNSHISDCPSGKCMRSHVNLTEITSTLSKVSALGVPNNKIVVGEASFGRSFHMASPGCWQAQCEFTGSAEHSEASPGPCTNSSGFISLAEIDDLLLSRLNTGSFHDNTSDSDVVLYNGDYIAYTSSSTKCTRREGWQKNGYAGTADWSIDLQPLICVQGFDLSDASGGMCPSSCALGYCPESLCRCTGHSYTWDPPVFGYPAEGYDNSDPYLNGLCQVACRNGFCNKDLCHTLDTPISGVQPEPKATDPHHDSSQSSPTPVTSTPSTLTSVTSTQSTLAPVIPIPMPTNPHDDPSHSFPTPVIPVPIPAPSLPVPAIPVPKFPWPKLPWPSLPVPAIPIPNNPKPNIPKPNTPKPDTPKPDTPKPDTPKPDIPKPDTPTPDDPTPDDPTSDDPTPDDDTPNGPTPNTPTPQTPTPSFPTTDGPLPTKAPKPEPKPEEEPPCTHDGTSTIRDGEYRNTLLLASCIKDRTYVKQLVITTLTYAPNAAPSQVKATCLETWSQACYHYSSAIRVNPQWSTLTCPPEAATPRHRLSGKATSTWKNAHDKSWRPSRPEKKGCDMDEYPPAYLLDPNGEAFLLGGKSPRGQLMRYLPAEDNRGAGSMWRGACFKGPVAELSDDEFLRRFELDLKYQSWKKDRFTTRVEAGITVDQRPEFTIASWEHTSIKPFHHYQEDDGLRMNPCWDQDKARLDPGYALLSVDPWYDDKPHPYDYKKKYRPADNPAVPTAA